MVEAEELMLQVVRGTIKAIQTGIQLGSKCLTSYTVLRAKVMESKLALDVLQHGAQNHQFS